MSENHTAEGDGDDGRSTRRRFLIAALGSLGIFTGGYGLGMMQLEGPEYTKPTYISEYGCYAVDDCDVRVSVEDFGDAEAVRITFITRLSDTAIHLLKPPDYRHFYSGQETIDGEVVELRESLTVLIEAIYPESTAVLERQVIGDDK